MGAPLPSSMERDWDVPATQTWAEYATEEAEAKSFATQNACLTCTTCSLFNFYAMATSVPWIMGNLLPCCWPFCLNSTCKSIGRCKPCCIVLHFDPPTDLYEVQVQSGLSLKGHLPEILIPGPEVRRLLGFMLNREPGMSDVRELENLWHVLREVLWLPDRVVAENNLGKLKTMMDKMLRQGIASRTGKNSVISTYYRTGAFGTQQISINGSPPQEAGVAISNLVKSSILASGRDVLFDPNETSFLDDVRTYLDYKAKVSKSWLNRVKSAQTFIGKLADGGKRLWAVMYALALTRAAQTKSPVVVIRRCSQGPSGKPYPTYGDGQDFEMDFMERRRNLDEVYASAGCKPVWPLLSTLDLGIMSRLCFNGVRHYLELHGKSHMVVIEHDDSVQGVANVIAALSGGTATVQYGEVGADGKLVNPSTVSAKVVANKGLVPDMVKAVAEAAKGSPNITMDNFHERNGLISMVTTGGDWIGGKAHMRLRMATIGRPDFVFTPDMKGGKMHSMGLPGPDPAAICGGMNCKACGCYCCTGVVKNESIATSAPPRKTYTSDL